MNIGTKWKVVATLAYVPANAIGQPVREIVIANGEVASYTPDLVDALVKTGASEAMSALDRVESDVGKVEGIQFCVWPVLLDGLRPSFNLSAEAIVALSKLNASLDFDPY